MMLRATWRGYRILLGGILLSLCAGCALKRSSDIDPARIKTDDNIVKIVQFWPQTPWLQDSDRVVGFKATVYFVSGQTQKGVFVPGNIFIWVYELEPAAGGRREPRLAHMWEFSESEAVGFRVNKRGVMGYYYGFPLKWPQEISLEGKLVKIQFGYERANKQVVLSSERRFRVPIPADYQPPIEETEP